MLTQRGGSKGRVKKGQSLHVLEDLGAEASPHLEIHLLPRPVVHKYTLLRAYTPVLLCHECREEPVTGTCLLHHCHERQQQHLTGLVRQDSTC